MYGRACIVHIVISHLHHGGGYYYEKSRETFRVLTTRFSINLIDYMMRMHATFSGFLNVT